jgi:hypothetical protein
MKSMLKISFVVLFLFSLFGLIIFTNLIHESSHKQDFKEVKNNLYPDSICLLEIGDDAIASYNFYTKNNSKEEFERISKYTEIKAYGLSISISILYLFCFSLVFWNIRRGK